MATPPPLPPLWPAPPAPKNGVLSGCVIAGIVVVSMALVGSTAVFFARWGAWKPPVIAPAIPQKPLPPLTAVQKAHARQFGILLVNALNSSSGTSVEEMTDFEAVADRALEGVPLQSNSRQEFIKGLKKNPAGILTRFQGSHAKVLRLIDRAGMPALTLRASPGLGVSYVDVVLRPDGDSFKVVDVFGYQFGSLLTTDARQAMMTAQSMYATGIGRLLGFNKAEEREAEMIKDLVDKQRHRDFKGVVATYEAMPPALQKTRTAFAPYLTALGNLQAEAGYEKAYTAALESTGGILGKDAVTDLTLFELRVQRHEYAAAQRCMERVRLVIGEDAKLYQLQGCAALEAGDLAAAEHCLAAAEKLEPELADLVDLRLQVRAMKRDFAGVVSELRRYANAAHFIITPAMLKEPAYDEFKKSPEFAAWAKQAK